MHLLISLDIIFIHEMIQLSSQTIAVLDIILHQIRNTNIFLVVSFKYSLLMKGGWGAQGEQYGVK